MPEAHVADLLVPYLGGELRRPEVERVEAHLAACGACDRERHALARLMAALATGAPVPPPVDWGTHGAELARRLEGGPGARAGPARVLRPAAVALAATLVGLLLYLGGPGLPGKGRDVVEPTAMEHAILAHRLDLITTIGVVERLELLEDFEVIRQLGRLPGRGEG